MARARGIWNKYVYEEMDEKVEGRGSDKHKKLKWETGQNEAMKIVLTSLDYYQWERLQKAIQNFKQLSPLNPFLFYCNRCNAGFNFYRDWRLYINATT